MAIDRTGSNNASSEASSEARRSCRKQAAGMQRRRWRRKSSGWRWLQTRGCVDSSPSKVSLSEVWPARVDRPIRLLQPSSVVSGFASRSIPANSSRRLTVPAAGGLHVFRWPKRARPFVISSAAPVGRGAVEISGRDLGIALFVGRCLDLAWPERPTPFVLDGDSFVARSLDDARDDTVAVAGYVPSVRWPGLTGR